MHGMIADFNSRRSTHQYLDECRKFYMFDPDKWDQSGIMFSYRNISSVHHGPEIMQVLPPITNFFDAPYSLSKDLVV